MKNNINVSLPKYMRDQLTKLFITIFASICIVGFTVTDKAFAAAPFVKTQAPGFYNMMVGDFEITALSDGTASLPVSNLLQGNKEEIKNLMNQAHLGENVETSVNAYLINTGSKLILVDAGSGSAIDPNEGKLVQNLLGAGYKPEQVDYVLLTHLHSDHVSGLSNNGNRVFPNATVYVEKREADYWLNKENLSVIPDAMKSQVQIASDAVEPYVKADKFKTFDGELELVPGVHGEPAFGHTPGHAIYVAESKEEEIIFSGDVVHSTAVQFTDPLVTFALDSNNEEAADFREKLFSQASENRWIIAGEHIPFPGLGYVHSDGNKQYNFIPVNYSVTK